MSKFFNELKRRNVIKAAIAYLVVAWVLLQVATVLLDTFHSPDWIKQAITIVLIIGLPIWIIISWIYDFTPKGIEKTAKDTESQLTSEITGKRLNVFIIVSLSIAVVFMGLKLSNVFVASDKQLSIAVLPFDNKSSEGDTQWFCDGISGSILTNLSKISRLTIISETSSIRFKETNKSIPEIANELGVSYVLEGDVTIHKNQIKINAQLINSKDKHVWAEDYIAEFENVLNLQSDIAKEIAEQLEIKLSANEEETLNSSSTTNIEAYKKYLKGLAIINTALIGNNAEIKAAYEKSIVFFKDAISLDPNYADAYAEIAISYLSLYFYGSDGKDYLKLSKDFNAQAIGINPNTSLAYNNLALISKYVEHDDFNFEKNIKKALDIDPNNAKAHMEYAYHFEEEDYYDANKMLFHINKANLLDPLSNEIKAIKVNALIYNSKFDESEVFLNKVSNIFESHVLVEIKGLNHALKHKDQKLRFSYLKDAIEKEPNNAEIYQSLSWYYNTILKDKINYLKYAEKAFELNSTAFHIVTNYFYALYINEKFDTAKQIIDNPSIFGKYEGILQSRMLFDFYAYQGKYDIAQEYLKKLKPLNEFRYNLEKAWLNSKMGDIETVNDVFQNHAMTPVTKSISFAYLKQKDSMYFYLDKISNLKNPERRFRDAMKINSDISFYPYLNESRFQDFLKKHYLPFID